MGNNKEKDGAFLNDLKKENFHLLSQQPKKLKRNYTIQKKV